MATSSSYRTDLVRAALAAIVADAERGSDVLDLPQDLANLLSDYLPDCPKESGLLLAAASARLSSMIRGYADQGIDAAATLRMAAASLADRAAFTTDACQWVTAEIGRAVGLTVPSLADLPLSGINEDLTQSRPPTPQEGFPVPARKPIPAIGGSGLPIVVGRRRWRQSIAMAALTLAVIIGATVFVIAHHGRAAATVLKVPRPDLGRLVPAAQRVLHVTPVDLDAEQVPQVAVTTTTGTPVTDGSTASENVLVLAWDAYARRWSVVYNATRDQVTVSPEPDAFTDSFQSSYLPPPAPLIPARLGVESIGLRQIRDQPGGAADLLITANVLYADGYGQDIGILHYDGKVARVVWAFIDRGGTATDIGAPGHQEVAVTSSWATPSDPQCCPARSYRFILAKAQRPQIGEIYRVISDNRPWIGAIIAEQPPQSPDSAAIVVSVVPGSPAAGILQRGDLLIGISGSSATGHGLGPAIFDQLAASKPGQTVQVLINRDGNPLTVTVTLGSLASPKAINAGNGLPIPNGTGGRYML